MPKSENQKRTPDVKWLIRSAQSIVVRNLLTIDSAITALPNTRCEVYAAGSEDGQLGDLLLRSDAVSHNCNPTWALSNLSTTPALPQHIDDEFILIRVVLVDDENMVLLSQKIDLRRLMRFGYVRYGSIPLPINFVALNIDDVLYITESSRRVICNSTDTSEAMKKFIKQPWTFLEVDIDDDDDDADSSSRQQRDPVALSGIIAKSNNAVDGVRKIVASQLDNLKVTRLVATKTKKEFELAQLAAEVTRAEQELHSDEQMLAQEDESIADVQDIRKLMKLCDEALAGKEEAEQVLVEKKKNLLKAKFLLEARQLKLLSDLQTIYPIDKTESGDYAIRGLEIPADFQSKDDEVISAALGYVVHLIVLASKYLEIPLRYNLLYMGSRSFIRDPVLGNAGGTYPLFKRNVEKERFDRGIIWLKRDIEQLLLTRGIYYDPGRDILYNLHQLFYCEMCPKLGV